MVAKDGTPKILDFGLARIMPVEEPEEPNQLGSDDETLSLPADQLNKPVKPPSDPSAMSPGPKLMGTPSYMSPEQAESGTLDHRTDIFSFGVVMYEALTGRKAFEGSSRQSLLASIIKAEPESVPTIKPVTPYTLWQVMDRTLRKNRMDRTQTARELYSDLKGVQKDVEAGMVLVDASQSAMLLRHPVLITAGVLLVVLTAFVTWALKPVPPSDPPLRKFSIPWPGNPSSIDDARISPDGTMIVYPQGGRLWIRDLNRLESRPITDDEQATGLLWSPHNDFIIYSALNDGKWTLSKVFVQGGTSDGYPCLYEP